MVKKCKKCPFEISITSYKLIFVFIFPICGVLQNRLRDEYIPNENEYFLTLLYYLSYLFSFIFLIIMRLLYSNNEIKEEADEIEAGEENKKDESMNESKDNSKDESESESIVKEKKNNNILSNSLMKAMKNKRIRKFLFIFIILLICASSLAYNHFDFEGYYDKRTIGMAYKIPEFFLLSHFILEYNYYRHHFITFGLNIITLIAKYIITLIQSNSTDYIGKHLWFYFLFATSNCFIFIFGKFFMNKFYKSPYFIMFIVGGIMSLILVIVSTIKYFIIGKSEIFSGFSDYIYNVKLFFLFLLDILLQFIYNLGLWITTFYFTPCHTIISENIMEIEYYLYDYKKNKDSWINNKFYLNFYTFPIIHIINLLCSLVFNEIIILNFCNLDYYTNIRIQERGNMDMKYLSSLRRKSEEDDKILSTEIEE